MTLSEEEIDRRFPVWAAMAVLFLDTDYLGIVGPDKVAARIAPADFDLPTLDCIFSQEVAPAMAFNLFDVAGEWAGWDPQWLRQHITTVARSTRPRHRLARRLFRSINRKAWLEVRSALPGAA